ncbi:GtrA family protein [Candidatus Nomurabacteria bacterium]|nr:GtrA family protein [Candidatus Nomurabacteria bacterium]
MKRVLLKVVRFLISGGLGALVGLAVIYVLTEYLGIWYIYSSVIAFIPSCAVSFILKKFWTFEDKSIEKIENQSFLYLILSITYLVINTTLIYFTVRILNVHYLVAQASWICILVYPDFLITNKIFLARKAQ